MSIKLSSLAANLKAETEGEWVDVPEWPGVRLRVRGASYPPFQTALRLVRQKLFRKYPGAKAVPADEEDIENGKLYAQHLLLEWEGFDVVYSADTAREQLVAPEMRELRAQVAWAAAQVGQTTIAFDDALGNLKGGSAGA